MTYKIANKVYEINGISLRVCIKCNEEKKYPADFWKKKRGNQEYSARCSVCLRKEAKNNPKKQFQNCKGQAKGRGFHSYLSFHEWESLRSEKNCECCGVEFEQSITTVTENNPRQLTVDRVDNSVGYVASNCKAVCRECNDKKTSNSVESLKMILEYIESNKQ